MRISITLGAVTLLGIAACERATPATTAARLPTTSVPADTTTSHGEKEALIAAAQAEGVLTTIGLPPDLCNYDSVIEGFKAAYGLDVNEMSPDAVSVDQLDAIRSEQGSTSPDVVDIWISFGPDARAEGLFAPYKVSTWDTIREAAKDPNGYWYGGYYGVLAFEVNADVVDEVPETWSDLLDPAYRGQVSLAGDPRVSNQAAFSVYAAALGNGGSLDRVQPGLDFFAKLKEIGNLTDVIADSTTVASGEAPVAIRWTYSALVDHDSSTDVSNIEVVVPDSGRLAGVYVQAISAEASHPNAAKLWMEYLHSDEGQLGWLAGYCYPIRYEELAATDAIPAGVASELPSSSGTLFPTVDQIRAAIEFIATRWDSDVGVNVGRLTDP